jgi:response regulator NasT
VQPGQITFKSSLTAKAALVRILILDDLREFTETLAVALRHAGHSTASFSHPQKALEVIGEYDVLIADYHLPGMTGLEMARRAHAQGWRGSFLLMSGHPAAMGESVEHPLLRGILYKPFSYAELLRALLGLAPPRE